MVCVVFQLSDACAAPKLRVALETVASVDEDEEGLRGVLDPLEISRRH